MVGTDGAASREGAWIEPPIPRSRSFSTSPLLSACVCVVCVCSEDVESGLTAIRGARGGEGERDLDDTERLLSRSTVDTEPEKKRGVSHVAGAVADLRFSFSFFSST